MMINRSWRAAERLFRCGLRPRRNGIALLVLVPALLSASQSEGRTQQGDLPGTSRTGLLGTSSHEPPLRVLSSSELGVEFELELGDLSVAEERDGCAIRLPGTDRLAFAGEPDLPGLLILVGIPQEGGARLVMSAERTESLRGVDVRPEPGFGPEPKRLDSIFGRDRFWPESAAEIVEVVTLRNIRVARIALRPVQYNPVKRELLVHHRLGVRVVFDRPAEVETRGPDQLDSMLERILLNGSDAVSWKLDLPAGDTVDFFSRSDVWCKVSVESSGVYQISLEDLEDVGFVLDDVDPRTFRLFSIGRYVVNEDYPDTMVEVPVYVKGEEDGAFSRGDYLAFYAEAPLSWVSDTVERLPNLFTRYNHYWLTWGGNSGARMAAVSGAGARSPVSSTVRRLRVEADSLCPARSGLLWLWRRLYKPQGRPTAGDELELALPQRESVLGLKVRVYGRTGLNRLRLLLNGVELDTYAFGGSSSQPPAVDLVVDTIPTSVSEVGELDTLRFELQGDPEMEVYVDFLEVRYSERLRLASDEPELFFPVEASGAASNPVEFAIDGANGDVLLLDVTDPWSPRRIVDAEVSDQRLEARVEVAGSADFFCVLASGLRKPASLVERRPSDLRSSTEDADYHIVCPDEFHAVARAFARYREGNVGGVAGARVRAVQLSDIYDSYGFGMEEPGVIKKFLAAKQPAYVLFCGDATYDYRNNLGRDTSEIPPMVPAYEVGYDIDPEVYGSAAKAYDAWYADWDGNGRGPDMILGRITCRSQFELAGFVNRVKRYENQEPGFWAKRFLVLADDEWLGEPGKRDPIGFLHVSSGCEPIVDVSRGLLDPVKVYLTEYRFTNVNEKAAATRELLARLNQGALFWCFFGHGAGFQLCHEEALHITKSVPLVDNGDRSPVAFFGSCGVGRFEDTRYESVAEELVRKGGGCIASSGATKATISSGNEAFARYLFGSIVEHPEEPVGAAFFNAWVRANTEYQLFGDPATMVRLPKAGTLPVVVPDTFRPGGRNEVFDSVPIGSGLYEASVHEANWSRYYSSDAGTVEYVLPGYEIHRAIGNCGSGQARFGFVVPRIDYPDTLVVPDGRYVREPATSSVSVLSCSGMTSYASRRDSIVLGEPVEFSDSAPPVLSLCAEGRSLDHAASTGDTVSVPGQFILEGVVEDESGILLAPVPDYGFGLSVGVGQHIDLASRFSYDKNSSTRGRFSCELDLSESSDTVVPLSVVVSDNLKNRLLVTYHLRSGADRAFKVSECLVHPNPVSGAAVFTFELSLAALVSVKVYTISGRLVRSLPRQACGFGYNQIEWDGRDAFGNPLPNGIYLYKLDAQSSEADGVGFRASHRDRLLVLR